MDGVRAHVVKASLETVQKKKKKNWVRNVYGSMASENYYKLLLWIWKRISSSPFEAMLKAC